MSSGTYIPASALLSLADWHVTKAFKALTFPGEGREVEMRKAAEVHANAAERLRELVDRAEEVGS